MHNIKKDNTNWLAILFFTMLIIILLVIVFFPVQKSERTCTNTINNICVDTNSQFCGCDMSKHQCMTREVGLCNLARCLTNKNVTLYYLNSCPHCRNQLELLKPFDNSINKIECSTGNCRVQVVPTWSNGTNQVQGLKQPEELFEIWNCGK